MADALGHKPGNLRFGHRRAFESVSFAGRSVLDIGAGNGTASFYAACRGARRVVALEPEAAGSAAGARERFERVQDRLGAERVELRGETIQEFDPDGERFDVIISLASINHLDEDACARLHEDPDAWEAYRGMLARVAAMAQPGAKLIVADCSRHNLFARLGIKNPLAPTIEWHKHQPPKLWAKLLGEVGFDAPHIRWFSFNTLRQPGRVLLGNRFAAYLLTSGFLLTMERGSEPATI